MRTKRLLTVSALCAIALLLSLPLSATPASVISTESPPNAWQSLPGPTGGSVSHIVITPDHQWNSPMFAAIQGRGIYRSDNDGYDWSPTNAGPWTFIDLQLSPNFAQDNTLFALIGSWQSGYTLRTSPDGGHTWISSVTFPGGLALSISPDFANDQTMYLLTGSQLVYRSTDGGDTFSLLGGWLGQHTLTALVFSPDYANDQTLYALVLNEGLYRSTDGGTNWQPAGLSGNFSALALSPNFANDELLLVIGSDGAIHRSADGGASWATIGGVLLNSNGRFTLAFSPTFAADQVVMAASSADPGPYRSLDGGLTWEAAGWYDPNSYQDGLIGGGVQDLALAPNQYWDGRLFAATRVGIAFSADRGSGWTQMNNGLPILGVRALTHAPNQPQLLLAGSAYFERARFDSGALIPDSGAIHRSTDGGQTWKQVSGRLARLNTLALSPDFANDQIAFAAAGMIGQHGFAEGGLYRSTDGGKNWTAVSPAPHAYTALAISPNYATDHTLWAAGMGATTAVGLYRSTNGGTTWALIAPGLAINQLAVSPNFTLDGTLFAATSSGVQRSLNGGQSWSQVLATPQATALAISPLYGASRTVYAAARAEATAPSILYRSSDGGATWQPLENAIPPQQGGKPLVINALAFAVDGSVLAGGRYGADGPAAVYRSSDGGASWAALEGVGETAVSQLTSQPANSLDLYAATSDGLKIRHLPQGEPAEPGHWQSSGPRGGRANALAVSPSFASDGIAFAGGTLTDFRGGAVGNGVSRSADYGQTWSDASNGLAPFNYSSALLDYAVSPAFATDQTLFAATWGGLFRSESGGDNWSRLATPNTGAPDTIFRVALAPDFPESGHMLATGSYSVPTALYLSEDGGQSWRTIPIWDPEDPPAGLISVNEIAYSPDFAADQTIFLATSLGPWRSNDGGETWTQLDDALFTAIATSTDYTNDQTVFGGGQAFYRSPDGGATWISRTVGNGATIRSLAVSPDYALDQTLFAGTDDGLYWSEDSGESWTAVSSFANIPIARLALSPQWPDHPVLLIGTMSGVYRLLGPDPADGLMEQSQGLAQLTTSSLALSPDGSLLLTGAMNHGVYGSEDGGASWRPFGFQGGSDYYAIPRLAISPNHAVDNTLFAVRSRLTGIGTSIYRSVDGGATWQFVHSSEYVSSLAISPGFASDGLIFAASGGYVRYSDDGGMNWLTLAGWDRYAQGAARVLGLPPEYPGDGRLLVGGSNGFWFSGDGGANWSQALSGLTSNRQVVALAVSPDFGADGTLLALGEWSDPAPDYTYRQAFFRSVNGGVDWSPVMDGVGADEWLMDVAFSPDFAANQTAYALTNRALYRSRDGGASWVEVGSPPGGPALSHLAVDSVGRVYVSSDVGVWRYSTLRHNLIVNGGFEGGGGWSLPATVTPGQYGKEVAYNGRFAMRLGLDNEANRYGYSSARQTIVLPPGTLQATLTFHLYPASGEAALTAAPTLAERWLEPEVATAGDAQYVLLIDPVTADVLQVLHWGLSNAQAWQRYAIPLSREYAGRPLLLHFGVLNDGVNGRSALYIDDVSLTILDSALAPYQLHLPLTCK